MRACPVSQIRRAEQQALAQGRELMPLAGAAAADFISSRFAPGRSVLVLAGPGNNGGDALVAATVLRARGYSVQVLMPGVAEGLPSDAARAYAGWRKQGGSVQTQMPQPLTPDVIIDGLFGIGLNRPLEPAWQAVVDTVNALACPILALDVPSGVDADSGRALGRVVQAHWTLCFIGVSRGLLAAGPGRDAAGQVYLETLGVQCQGEP